MARLEKMSSELLGLRHNTLSWYSHNDGILEDGPLYLENETTMGFLFLFFFLSLITLIPVLSDLTHTV